MSTKHSDLVAKLYEKRKNRNSGSMFNATEAKLKSELFNSNRKHVPPVRLRDRDYDISSRKPFNLESIEKSQEIKKIKGNSGLTISNPVEVPLLANSQNFATSLTSKHDSQF